MMNVTNVQPAEITMPTLDKPLITCSRCQLGQQPSFHKATAKEWLAAAKQCGWRKVKTSLKTFKAVCPQCLTILESSNA